MPTNTAKFPKGVPMSIEDVAAVVGPEFQEMNENPPPSVVKVREEMEGKTAVQRERLTWTKAADSSPGGLYGFPKSIQRSAESASRKLARTALRVAKRAFAKDEGVVDFLQTHAKRENSRSARVLLAAMGEIGPKLNRTASVKRTLTAPEQRDALANLRLHKGKKNPATGILFGSKYPFAGEEYLVYDFNAVGYGIELVLLSKDGKTIVEGVPVTSKTAGAPDYGLYGFKSKTADLGLDSCKEVRTAAGRITADLHRRKADLHDKLTGFWKEQSKQAKCAYAGMLLSCYPDASMKFAAQSITGSVLPNTNRFVHTSTDLRAPSGSIREAQVLPSEVAAFRRKLVATFGHTMPLSMGPIKEAHVSSFVNEDGRSRDVEGTVIISALEEGKVMAQEELGFTGLYEPGPKLTVLASGDFLEWED